MIAIIVGYGKLEQYTLPFIRSIKATNPELDILVVDNFSPEPYPEIEGCEVIRNDNSNLFSGLNFGIKHKKSDWYLLLNNDIIFHKPIIERIKALSQDTLYGFYINPVGGPRGNGLPWEWLSNWCSFLSHKIWEKVGDWDTYFHPMWGEDMDYSKRVLDAGFKQQYLDRVDWGIEHLMYLSKKQERLAFLKNKKHTDAMIKYLLEKHG